MTQPPALGDRDRAGGARRARGGDGQSRFAFTPILPMMQEDAGVSIAMGGGSRRRLRRLPVGRPVRHLAAGPRDHRGSRGLVTIGLATLAMGLEHRSSSGCPGALAGVASAWVLIYVRRGAWRGRRARSARLSSTVFAGVGAGIAVAGGALSGVMHAQRIHACLVVLGASRSSCRSGSGGVRVGRCDADEAEPPAKRAVAWDRESVRLVLCYGAFGSGTSFPHVPPGHGEAGRPGPLVFAGPGRCSARRPWDHAGDGDAAKPRQHRRLWIASHLVMALGVVLPVIWPASPRSCSPRSSSAHVM